MQIIDFELLAAIRADKANKKVRCVECPELMKQLSLSNSNLLEYITNEFVKHELAKYIKSNEYYISEKSKFSQHHYKPKDIVYADLGTNFRGEYSYERPCVVIKEGNEKIFIVPCSSSKDPYDRRGNLLPDYKIGLVEDGFSKKTVIILKDARWISKSRVLSKYPNKVNPELFKEIYNAVFFSIFDLKEKEFRKEIDRLSVSETQNLELIRENESIKENLERVTRQLESMTLLLDGMTAPDVK